MENQAISSTKATALEQGSGRHELIHASLLPHQLRQKGKSQVDFYEMAMLTMGRRGIVLGWRAGWTRVYDERSGAERVHRSCFATGVWMIDEGWSRMHITVTKARPNTKAWTEFKVEAAFSKRVCHSS